MKNIADVSDMKAGGAGPLAEERAQRVRLVRRMIGLTRAAFARKYGISSANFQNWEGPRYGGLTEKAARKLVTVCGQEGVETTVEWLMYGSGTPPTIVPPPRYGQLQVKAAGQVYKVASASAIVQGTVPQEKRSIELARIAQELEIFKQNYNHDVLVMVVTDKSMEPFCKIGDYVAGKRYVTNMAALLQSECIIETVDRKLMVRILQAGNEPNKYNLASYNAVAQPTIQRNVEILNVAPVMWVRRLGQE